LSYFDFIVPCGIVGVQMTSIEAEKSSAGELLLADVDAVATVTAAKFGDTFALDCVDVKMSELPLEAIGSELM
jgi:lipoate-protein ligase B